MAEFVEVITQKERMCANYNRCNMGCQINNAIQSKKYDCTTCVGFCIKYPKVAEGIIMNWAKEHPIKTNADKFKEVFGVVNIKLNCDIFECSEGRCSECEYENFWNEEYKEPKNDK